MSVANTVPLYFDPLANEFDHHFQIVEAGTNRRLTWPVTSATLIIPGATGVPTQLAIQQANADTLAIYPTTGFSIGLYFEFLVAHQGDFATAGYKLGRIEVTFGYATPLMAYLFNNEYREAHDGPWQTIFTARIFGARSAEEAEKAFMNAAMLYEEHFSILPVTWSMGVDAANATDLFNREPGEITEERSAIADLEPLRFFYQGLQLHDAVAASISFYRILEYYSIEAIRGDLAALRTDVSVDIADFPKRVFSLFRRSEKDQLTRLVSVLIAADDFPLEFAHSHALINDRTSGALASSLYEYRNSIVHGKSEPGRALYSSPLLGGSMNAIDWSVTIKYLAEIALDQFGSRLD